MNVPEFFKGLHDRSRGFQRVSVFHESFKKDQGVSSAFKRVPGSFHMVPREVLKAFQ